FGHRLLFHDRHGAEQRRIVFLQSVEIDLRELRRRDLLRFDQRGQPVRRKECDVFFGCRDWPSPRIDGERRALERRGATLVDELFHERARSAWIWLERPRHWVTIAERWWRRLLRRLRCGTGRCLSERARTEAKRARGSGDQRHEDELA